ncbi:hypothetical protein RB213_015879 [Colletotrichum asianum]
MANTVLSAYTLSVFNFLTVFLLAVWTFNPLGSQSSFRSVRLQDQSKLRIGSVHYRSHALESLNDGLLGGKVSWGLGGPAARVAYSSVLTTATSATQHCNGTCSGYDALILRLGGPRAAGKQVAMDPWGSPRIPNLKHVPGYDPSRPEEWLTVPWNKTVQEYSSLIGRRNHGPQPNFSGNASFLITASYTEVFHSLERWYAENYKSFAVKYNATLDQSPYKDASYGFFSTDNRPVDASIDRGMFALDFNTTYASDSSGKTIPSSRVFIGSIGNERFCRNCMTTCSVKTVYVDAKVFCDSRSDAAKSQCRVDKVRHMPRPPHPPEHTIFNEEDIPLIAANTLKRFPTMERGDDESSPAATFSETFIEAPDNTFSRVPLSRVDWCRVPMDVFADRFSLLLNTFLDSTVDPVTVMGSELFDTGGMLKTPSNMTFPLPAMYVLDSTWMGIYFFSTILMFAVAITGLIFRFHIAAPQVLGYVGSLARDSPYFAHLRADANGTESGEELSRRLGRIRVGVFDVRPKDEVGKIAFAPVETGRRIRRQRWYSQDI